VRFGAHSRVSAVARAGPAWVLLYALHGRTD
jgi:hypothetical protein